MLRSFLFQNLFWQIGYYFLHTPRIFVPTPRHPEYVLGRCARKTAVENALQSFATALLVAAPPLEAHQRPALCPIRRIAHATVMGHFHPYAAFLLLVRDVRMSFASAYLGSLLSLLRGLQKSRGLLPLRTVRPLCCILFFVLCAHLPRTFRGRLGRLRWLCCWECNLFRGNCRSFAFRTHFLADSRPALSYRELRSSLACSLFGRFHLLGFLHSVGATFESFTFATTVFVIVVFLLDSPKTSCMTIEILATICFAAGSEDTFLPRTWTIFVWSKKPNT